MGIQQSISTRQSPSVATWRQNRVCGPRGKLKFATRRSSCLQIPLRTSEAQLSTLLCSVSLSGCGLWLKRQKRPLDLVACGFHSLVWQPASVSYLGFLITELAPFETRSRQDSERASKCMRTGWEQLSMPDREWVACGSIPAARVSSGGGRQSAVRMPSGVQSSHPATRFWKHPSAPPS
jgi:hypothetical protein